MHTIKQISIAIFLFFLCQTIIACDLTRVSRKSKVEEKQTLTYDEKKINKILETLKEQDSSKDLVNLLTIIVAFVAVAVSGIATYLNYKVFRGQSISSFRKNWNNNLIDTISEFIIISSNLFGSLKNGVLPSNFDSEIINLNKIYYSTTFKLHEIGVNDKGVNTLMYQIINLIISAKKTSTSTKTEDFYKLISELSNNANIIISDNWAKINKFK